ncbi:hypothetical protein IWX83_002972 [Flavobacterium sp. CG_9.1]|uniref:hypothetical protein n=1 Tax=Flavobacterium sp. CG_9.1 TaxID=2787728 RepID=UPI0018C9D223|nr:hypothetical protein [Flavobacterium sp. CG_9.1]MBG6063162.1 hypothetical protein [Flavobacterium sp. CG_9.1]
MNKLVIITFACLCMLGCSTDNPTAKISTFNIELAPSTVNVTVDEPFTITVNANEKMAFMGASLDNFATGGLADLGFGNSYVLHFNFDTLGQKTILVRAQNSRNELSEKKVVVNVTRGNAIKITGMKVLSFYNINQTWDPEYVATDPNRLADVYFGYSKSSLNNYFDSKYSIRKWFVSSVKENQGDLTWNLTTNELYIKPNGILRFGLVDQDAPPLGQDLLNGPPDFRDISFADYLVSKPKTITYSFPEINLQFILSVEWSN